MRIDPDMRCTVPQHFAQSVHNITFKLNFSVTGNLTTPDGAAVSGYFSLEFPFEYLNDFALTTDAIMTVDIKLSDTNIGLLKWTGYAQNSTKAIRVDFDVDNTATPEVAPISIVGQFINNPA